MVKKKSKPHTQQQSGGRPKRFTLQEIDKYADEFLEWLKDPLHIWFKDFCLDKDLDPDFMSEWAEESEHFRGAYRQAKVRQESRLVNGGLTGGFNSAITKLVLNHAHDWVEKQATPNTNLAPRQDDIDKDHRIMELEYKLSQLEANADKPKAE